MPDKKSGSFSFKMKIPCSNPRLAVDSMLPDIRPDKYSKISLTPERGFVELSVESTKLGHMKAIVNTYISLVATLEDVEKKV